MKCPCEAQDDRSQVTPDGQHRRCLTCDKVFDRNHPAYAAYTQAEKKAAKDAAPIP